MQCKQEIIKVRIPVSTNVPIEMSPASPKIHKTPPKHKISDYALTHIQSQTDILQEEIEQKNIGKGDENEILYERIVILEKENNSLKNEIKHEQLIVHMLTSSENGNSQWKFSKSINPDLLDKPETPTSINLTN